MLYEVITPELTEQSVFLPVGTSSVTINAEAEDSIAIVSGIGTFNVQDNGVIVVTVTSQNGLESVEYSIVITSYSIHYTKLYDEYVLCGRD